jgi:hypothetical protein
MHRASRTQFGYQSSNPIGHYESCEIAPAIEQGKDLNSEFDVKVVGSRCVGAQLGEAEEPLCHLGLCQTYPENASWPAGAAAAVARWFAAVQRDKMRGTPTAVAPVLAWIQARVHSKAQGRRRRTASSQASSALTSEQRVGSDESIARAFEQRCDVDLGAVGR